MARPRIIGSRVTHVVRPLLDQQEALSHRLTAVERPTLRKSANTHSLRFLRGAPSDTPSLDACVYSAPALRFSRRAITVVFVFSRARVLSVRMSSFVQSRRFTVFFAIYVLPATKHADQSAPHRYGVSPLASPFLLFVRCRAGSRITPGGAGVTTDEDLQGYDANFGALLDERYPFRVIRLPYNILVATRPSAVFPSLDRVGS
jgi:hypothetical protein